MNVLVETDKDTTKMRTETSPALVQKSTVIQIPRGHIQNNTYDFPKIQMHPEDNLQKTVNSSNDRR